jgi:hypothetical protein
MPLLRDSDIDVRIAAMNAAAKLQAMEAIPTIIYFIKDKEPKIRVGAMDALIELQGKEAIRPIASLLQDEEIDVRNAAEERLSHLQDPLLTDFSNTAIILLMVICPILAFLPLFLTGKKFFASLAAFIASLFVFHTVADASLVNPHFKQGTMWREIYQAGVLIVFASSMFLKLCWWIIVNLFKRSPDIEADKINAESN